MIEQILAGLADYWLTLVAILALICASAFFSGSETALTATSRARMHTLEVNGDERAGLVNSLIERRDRLIGALLIGNNAVNILASSLTTSAVARPDEPTTYAASALSATMTVSGPSGIVSSIAVTTSVVLASPAGMTAVSGSAR